MDRTEFMRDPLILLELMTYILTLWPFILHDACVYRPMGQVFFCHEHSLRQYFYSYQALQRR